MYCLDVSDLNLWTILRSSLCRLLLLRHQQIDGLAKLRDVAFSRFVLTRFHIPFGEKMRAILRYKSLSSDYKIKYPCSKIHFIENLVDCRL